MSTELLIKNVRPMHGDAVDLRVVDGVIAAVGPNLTPGSAAAVVEDGKNRLVFPGFVDAHTHMDKTLIGLPWHRHEIGPTLLNLIENEREVRRELKIDPHAQSSRHARIAVATGTTSIRTHVDIDTDWGLAGFHGVAQTREDFKDALDMQIVAFPQSGMLVRPGTIELIDEALGNGANVVGGLDPSTIDRDPAGHLNAVFKLAEKHDVDVDIHLHEPGDLGAFSVELIAERTKTLGFKGRVVISHAFCLGGIDDAYLSELIELFLENDITIMSHGPSGFYPIPSVKRLLKAGVRMCTGNDGIRDSWGPLNMPDMLLRSFLVSYRNNFRRDDDIEAVLDIATRGGARVMGKTHYGLEPGCDADFVLVDGETHVQAVFDRPPRALVVKRGRIVARDGECLV